LQWDDEVPWATRFIEQNSKDEIADSRASHPLIRDAQYALPSVPSQRFALNMCIGLSGFP
jgi:hypothetical protein